jgi:hypothetical protein
MYQWQIHRWRDPVKSQTVFRFDCSNIGSPRRKALLEHLSLLELGGGLRGSGGRSMLVIHLALGLGRTSILLAPRSGRAALYACAVIKLIGDHRVPKYSLLRDIWYQSTAG